MAQQGKQMRVGACESFPYKLVKLVLLATITGIRLIFDTVLLGGKALSIHLKYCSDPTLTFLDIHSYL
jgi:hypothetical protein